MISKDWITPLLRIGLAWTFSFGAVSMPNILSMRDMHMDSMTVSPVQAANGLTEVSEGAVERSGMHCCEAMGQVSMSCTTTFLAAPAYADYPAGVSQRPVHAVLMLRSIHLHLPSPPPKV